MAMRNAAPSQLGLAAGMAVAAAQLSKHLGDGLRFQYKTLSNDKMFCVFLAGSAASFVGLAARDFGALNAARAAANAQRRKLEAAKAQPEDGAAASAVVKKKRKPKIDTGPEFWKQLRYLLRIAVPSMNAKTLRLMGAQFLLLVMRTLISVRTTKLSVYFLTNAISKASWKNWVRWLLNFSAWCGMSTVVNSGLKYFEGLIALELRQRLTKDAHRQYMRANNFYKTSVLDKTQLDNVDQRVCADIEAWSTQVAFLFGHSFKPILEFVLSLHEAAKELGYARPIGLFATQTVTSIVMRSFVPSLGGMIAKEAAAEGSFRHAHARLIAHAEEVAFLQGAETECGILDKQLDDNMAMRRWHALIRIRKNIAENIGKFQGLLIGGLFTHIPFMVRPEMGEAERISAFRATEELLMRCGGAFVEILLLEKSLQELAGYTARIHALFAALKLPPAAAVAAAAAGDGAAIGWSETSEAVIQFEGTAVDTPEPDGRARRLVSNLNMEVVPGASVLVTGPNGCGKTSLFRTLAGLWKPVEGSVRCPRASLMWLPQTPYLVLGTLRDQVAYPSCLGFDGSNDDAIRACLERVGLQRIAAQPAGLDLLHDEWNDVLSGGERQRIGFARLFYHKPAFAVLDEATSAINPDEEHRLYQQVAEMKTTVFSIAHRLELRKFHQFELVLTGDGSGKWELRRL